MLEEKLSSQGIYSRPLGSKPPFPPPGPGPKPPFPPPGPRPKPPYPPPSEPGSKPPYPLQSLHPMQPTQTILEVISMKACDTVNFHKSKVSVPVEIEPFAKVGQISTKCQGKPIITPGEICDHNKCDKTCKFVITQEIVVAIPISFGAKTIIGEEVIECMMISNDEDEEECN